jgi:phospholipase C
MEYAVFDHWFASVPASTQPNRFYVHSATSFGAMSNVREDLVAGFPQKTIFLWYLLPEHSSHTVLSQSEEAEVCKQVP